MKNQILFQLFLVLACLIPLTSKSVTIVSGDVSGQSWTNSQTYYVSGSIWVDNGGTLNIQAGTIIKFAPYTYFMVYGTLIADGTTNNKIIFTSKDDNSTGEIIPGSDGLPNPGDWYNIQVNGSGSYQGEGRFDYCEIKYSGLNYGGEQASLYIYATEFGYFKNSTIKYSMNSGVRLYSVTNLDFSNNVIQQNTGNGIDGYYSPINISGCTVSNNGIHGIFLYSSENVVQNCTISGNGQHGIYGSASGTGILNCQISNNNGWAAKMESCNIKQYSGNTGSNNNYNAFAIYGSVDTDLNLSAAAFGFPVVINGALTINNQKTVTIPAGEVIKLDYSFIQIYGAINAVGTQASPIVFTSFKDDTFGGDLNNDGLVSSPAKGDWYTISVNGSGANWGSGAFDHCIFRYGGRNYSGESCEVYIYGTEYSLFTNNTLEYSMNGGIQLYSASNIAFTNNISRYNDTYGFNFTYAPVNATNCTASNNGSYGLYLYSSDNVIQNCILTNNASHGIYGSTASPGILNCQISNNNGWAARIDNCTIKQYSGNTGSNNLYDAFAIYGTIDSDLTMSASAFGFPVVITGTLTVNNLKTVTVPAGEVIKLDYAYFQVYGAFNAIGNQANPIVFTSFKDDTYGGDLNNDGMVTSPAKGDWYSIVINGNGANWGSGVFDHCLFRYGGRNYTGESCEVYIYGTEYSVFTNNTLEYSLNGGIQLYSTRNISFTGNTSRYHDGYGFLVQYSPVDLSTCTASNNGSYGIYLYSSDNIIQNCIINNNGSHGIYGSSTSSGITNCQISNNNGWAARIENSTIKQYSGNTGTNNFYDAFGINGTVDMDLNLSDAAFGFTPVIIGLLTVNNQKTMTIPAGEVIKLDYANFYIYGQLNALGTQADPVIFTSFKDDTYGGDLNHDGAASQPAIGDWYTMAIYSQGSNWGLGYFDHCLFRYGGRNYAGENSQVYFYAADNGLFTNNTVEYSMNQGVMFYSCNGIPFTNNVTKFNSSFGIYAYSSEINIQNSTINNNGSHGIYCYSATPNIINCQINNNTGWAAKIENCSIKQYSGNTGSGNGYDAFGIYGTVDTDITLSHSAFGFPVVITANFTVNNEKTLTIPAGEVIKLDYANLQIYGSINATGTSTNPIIFTSFKDDSYGGDLNKDGAATSPIAGDWYTVSIYGHGSYWGTASFDYCKFRYGGRNYSGENSQIYFYGTDNGYLTNSIVEYGMTQGVTFYSTNNVVFDNTITKNNTGYGVYLYSSDINIQNCSFLNNGSHGIYGYSANPNILNCNISSNNGWAVKMDYCTIKQYGGNYGTGNAYDAYGINGTIDTDLNFSASAFGFPLVITGQLSVNTQKTVTIPAGEVIKLDNGVFFVYGSLYADGTFSQPIVFTSFKDDSFGGDLNKDGNVSAPQAGDWYNVTLNGTGSYEGEGMFDHCIFRYGGRNYSGENATLYYYANTNGFLKHSTIEFSLTSGLSAYTSMVQLRSNIFNDNLNYGLVVNYSPYPDLGSDVFENSGFNVFRNNNTNIAGQYQMYYYGSVPMPAFNNDWGYYTASAIDQHIYDDNELGTGGEVIFNPWFDPGDETWNLTVDFNVDFTQIHVGGLLQFADLSTGNPDPMTYQWDFDSDGIIDSELKNPTHIYYTPGIYTVTLIVSNGAFEKVLVKEEYVNVGSFGAPLITSVEDVPNDQGGAVFVIFNRSAFDTDTLATKSTEYYAVQINDGNGWFSAGYSSAYGIDSYTVICQTPFDSTAYSLGLLDFRVLAGMDEGTYASDAITGYSVDNIKPSAPTSLMVILGETTVQIDWDPSPDTDFHYFRIYRSTDPDNFPSNAYAFTTFSHYTDIIGSNENYFYQITAVDYTGNESDGSVVLTTTRQLQINIPQGWSGFSTYYNPIENLTADLFQPITSKLIILQNLEGLYWPGQNINTLVNWNILSGYAIKMNQQATFSAEATREQIKTITVPAGWSIIPVLTDNFVYVEELFFGSDISIVKDVAGYGVYWPAYNINTLGTLNPGRAYYLRANSQSQVTFPTLEGDKGDINEIQVVNHISSPWNELMFTNKSHIVAFTASSLTDLQNGDIIGAFTNSGFCAGVALYEGNPFTITMIGDDEFSPDNEGFTDHENIIFKVLRTGQDEPIILDVRYDRTLDYSGKFSNNSLSAINSLKLAPDGFINPNTISVNCFPNPTQGLLFIEGISISTKLEIMNVSGQIIGTHQLISDCDIDLSKLPKGIYSFKFSNDKGTIVNRIIIE